MARLLGDVMRRRAFAFALSVALAGSVAAQESMRFEVASVRPNTGNDRSITFSPPPPDGLRLTNYPLDSLIFFAYGIQSFRVVGLPAWTREARYDIAARAGRPISDADRRLMMRSLLTERFQLKARFESREQTAYVLTRVRPDGPLGAGLTPRPDCHDGKACESGGSGNRGAGTLKIRAITMARLADGMLSLMLDQVVRDESKTDGVFDVELSWRPDTAPPDDPRPSFFTSVEEQLGMKLTPERRPVDVLVVESIERATSD
jgi:uncharacterized protein (TIGR03435 family)